MEKEKKRRKEEGTKKERAEKGTQEGQIEQLEPFLILTGHVLVAVTYPLAYPCHPGPPWATLASASKHNPPSWQTGFK